MAERLRQAVEKARFKTDKGEISRTISIGVTELGEGDDMRSLIRKADTALYRAKQEGRNRFVVYSEDFA